MYNFTVIIPHKNIPTLLQRCINSIPQRNDLHLIIVDDNSDPNIVDFNDFPGKNRDNTTIIFNKDGLGAGHARNIGLDAIENSKWVFFADSDDFFTPYLNIALDKYKDAIEDLIFFRYNSVYSDTLKPSTRNKRVDDRILNAIKNNEFDIIRYKIQVPYCKLIKYKNIVDNNIRFDETMYSNDVMFGLKIGHVSDTIKMDENIFYTQTERLGSLVKIVKKESIDCRYAVAINANEYLKKINKQNYHTNLFSFCYKYAKINILLSIKCFFKSLKYTHFKFWYRDLSMCFKYFLNKE